ncbi:MAG TPA: ABC transporter substrate-binding protein, partial [Acidimicrobiia bacterium]|nr:ABC transporter substrate-binding protein [Acidimicrobiia bacterium]
CVPAFTGDNGGATHRGVTAETIKIAYYEPKPDPQTDALLQISGAYDAPDDTWAAYQAYLAIYEEALETYGRDIELVRLKGTGSATDAVAARADAIRADELGVFAVLNGPSQTKAFAEELAARDILCIGTCLIAQPRQFYLDNLPYIWNGNPSPDQTSIHTQEIIETQLVGKPAEYAGDEELRDQERSFALLTYDTPEGDFTPAWDGFKARLEDAGIELAAHVSYFLDLATAPSDARTVVTRLKDSGATTVIFSGDPFMPIYFTQEATAQGYFPEWLLSGTVLADTAVFARQYDQEQWAHAFGYSALPARTPQEEGAAYKLHDWWYGEAPPTENNYGIVEGVVDTLMTGIHVAGPDLTPESFQAALYSLPVPEQGPLGLRLTVSYGDHGIWDGEDPNGLDDATIVWWDPDAVGEDETGAEGPGMYRLVDGGRRYLPGEWPTDPLPLFDEEGTVTVYDSTPAELLPPREYDPPAGAPTASG